MIVTKKHSGYSNRKKQIHGKGFVDSLSSMFKAAMPTIRNIGSYVAQNKDELAKPLLGAVGNLAATGLELAGKKALKRLLGQDQKVQQLDHKSRDILQSLTNVDPIPVTNIMSGSGIMKF